MELEKERVGKRGKGEREKESDWIEWMDGMDVSMHRVYRLTGLGPMTVFLGFTPQHLHALP